MFTVGCGTADRSTFNNNLVKMFRTEFERDPANKYKTRASYGIMTSLDKKILSWKFSQLDANRDLRISRREIRGLKRMVRKLVQPRGCARRFTKYCDLNHNKKITKQEWFTCLGVDINIPSQLTFASLRLKEAAVNSPAGPKLPVPIQNDPPAPPPQLTPLHSPPDFFPPPAFPGSVETASLWAVGDKKSDGGSSDFLLRETESTTTHPNAEDAGDCDSQRKKAIGDQATNPNASVYIPDCQGKDGKLFADVQCHKFTQFCWCADTVTGSPISGTSSRYRRPNCDQIHVNLGDIKGCTEKKREKFFIRFHSTLESSMIASGHKAFSEEMSTKELAVRWKFDQLDRNKNNRLERREWKHYRREMKTWKGVKKCGRNFMRFCDQNGDKKITNNEWINCALKAQSKARVMYGRTGPPRGKNPFLSILDPNQ